MKIRVKIKGKKYKENLFWDFGYNTSDIPIAIEFLHIFGDLMLNYRIAVVTMSIKTHYIKKVKPLM